MALEKLIIEPFSDDAYSTSAGDAFTVMVNPEEYSRSFGIKYAKQQGSGSSAAPMKYARTDPEAITLSFFLDGTGALASDTATDVSTALASFETVAYEYNGDIHSPNYLKISWGALLFKGRLQKYTVSYTLFKPDGTPLRAKIKATFQESLSPSTISKQEGDTSPDLTHVHTVIAGDSLPLLCKKIYNDQNAYLQVARHNGLLHFRNLEPGQQLMFPPIAK